MATLTVKYTNSAGQDEIITFRDTCEMIGYISAHIRMANNSDLRCDAVVTVVSIDIEI